MGRSLLFCPWLGPPFFFEPLGARAKSARNQEKQNDLDAAWMQFGPWSSQFWSLANLDPWTAYGVLLGHIRSTLQRSTWATAISCTALHGLPFLSAYWLSTSCINRQPTILGIGFQTSARISKQDLPKGIEEGKLHETLKSSQKQFCCGNASCGDIGNCWHQRLSWEKMEKEGLWMDVKWKCACTHTHIYTEVDTWMCMA